MEVEHVDVLEIVNRVLGKDYKNKSFIETIKDLLALVKIQQKEYNSLFSSISEDDAIISSLQDELRIKEERIKELENHSHTMAKQHFESGLVKAAYMDLDD